MDCSACKSKIERVLAGAEGVLRADVKFMAQKLSVEFNPGVTSKSVLEMRVVKLGYTLQEHNIVSASAQSVSFSEAHQHANAGPQDAHKEAPKISTGVRKEQTRALLADVIGLAIAFVVAHFYSEWAVYPFVYVTLISGFGGAKKAFQSAAAGMFFTIEMLMTLACVGALFIGAAQEAATVVVLFALGEWLEAAATAHARGNIQVLLALAPPLAYRVEKGLVTSVPTQQLRLGDVIEVRPGSRVPTDGKIVEGQSQLDESLLTGESALLERGVGENVFAGTHNIDGVLLVHVEKTAENNALARILQMVEAAESRRSKTARFIDEFSLYYTPAILAFAAGVALIPPLFFAGQSFSEWIYRGLGVLLIGCPCALVLSVPASVTSAIAWGARRGLLIKGGAALEQFGKVTTFAFDKTGTLTCGKPALASVFSFREELADNDILMLAAAVEQGSSHPLAHALVSAAHLKELEIPPVQHGRALAGRAMSGTVWERTYIVGSPRYAKEKGALLEPVQAQVSNLEQQGFTVVLLLVEGKQGTVVLGLMSLRDTLRPDAAASVAALKKMGISSVMLTGDNAQAAQVMGRQLNIEVRSELLPEQKLEIIEDLKTREIVGMVGDGVNDAPGLAAAHVGVAMGQGTDVAVETADAVLSRNTVHSVVQLVRLSRRTRFIVQQNIGVALGLKAVFLITTLGGFTGLWMAVLADTGATVLVTLNALRLLSNPD